MGGAKKCCWNYLVINVLETTADATIGSRSVLASICVKINMKLLLHIFLKFAMVLIFSV